ncbi:glycosyltransferase family 2 protein [Hirschia litorea]|uniref:Glycosyltransferase family 2 protein n=1 Tax=Hirschia litorea TaxID=1199156 RepID=A0ABW2IGP3_9PROT
MSKSTNNDTVAIVIAAYNASNTIEKAVRSALIQKSVSQVIVVDDASQDNTYEAALLAEDNSGRLLVLKLPKNSGPSAARNLALKNTTAQWFTVLDADDYLMEGRIDKLLSLAGNDYDILADDLWLLEEGDNPENISPMLNIEPTDKVSDLSLETFIAGNLPQKGKSRRELGFLKPIIRKTSLDEAHLQYDEKMRLGEDYDLYVRLLANGAKAGLTSPQGYVAIRRANSLSGCHGHSELMHFYNSIRTHRDLPNLSKEARHLNKLARTNASRKYRWAKMIHAIKHGNIGDFLSCLTTSPDNIVFLFSNLALTLHYRLFKHKKKLDTQKFS